MKFTLKDYQLEALGGVLTNLRKARRNYRLDGDISQFPLTAPTGAGKTVIAAAMLEALFAGNDDFNFEADPTATVIWFSDDPSLNEQSRFRLEEAADELHGRLVTISNSFSKRVFEAGKVYFLNTQKLGSNSLLVRGHEPMDQALPGVEMGVETRPDARPYTIWDTISNTIKDPDRTLYLILDEAHRGMTASRGSASERSTIVLRLINGHGTVPPIPIVWGISATVDRFNTAMAGAVGRDSLAGVDVDAVLVQESGLLKDDIVLDIPAETGQFDTVLLRRGTDMIVLLTKAWAEYAALQDDVDAVIPLLVLQVPNKPDEPTLKRYIDTVLDAWPGLSSDGFANVLGEHTDLVVGPYTIPYVEPERVQESRHIRVLIAKDAISTGWDCPRAEVLVSFRPAVDQTHITQLIGRLVRTPLARRIPGDARLNAVHCVLPYFDRATATKVAGALMNPEAGNGGPTPPPPPRRVLVNPVDVLPNPAVPDEVWACFDALPSQTLPRKGARPIKRLTALGQALADDGLVPDAGAQAHARLHKVLDSLAVLHSEAIAAAKADVSTMDGTTVHARRGVAIQYDPFSEAADDRAIGDSYRAAGRAFTADVARTYVEHLANGVADDDIDDALREARVDTAALALVQAVQDDLEEKADKFAQEWLDTHRVAIKGLSDDRRETYDDLRALSDEPQRIDLTRPTVRQEETQINDPASPDTLLDIPTREHHLLASPDGAYPIGSLNAWEVSVLDHEMSQPGFLSWYRNPSTPSKDSLAVPYVDAKDRWRSMRPDFIFFSSTADGTVRASIVDPHGIHLADALPKLRGLAKFAEDYGQEFHRIEAVAKIGTELRLLDLRKEGVRQAVADAESADALYTGPQSEQYSAGTT